MINGLYDNAVFAINAEITQLRNDVLNLDKFRVIVYDPKEGNIKFQIYLPVDITSLQVLPSLSIQKYLNKAKAFGHRYLPGPGYCLWDTYYRYAPTTGLRNMIPPFTGISVDDTKCDT